MTVRLTDRDRRLFAKCGVCRWLTTNQVRRLYFPDATLNAVQKRLRKLADAGYLRSYQEHPTAESLHAVGPKGRPLVEARGIHGAAGGDVPGQVEHLAGVNELRLAVERGPVPVAYCFAYWELSDLGWRHATIPDLVFAVHAPGRRTFVAEYDRGTETLDKLLGKVRRYATGLDGFPFEAVLIVSGETRRFDVLAREMQKHGVTVRVLVAALDTVRSEGVFQAAFTDLGGGMRKLLDRLDVNEDG